MSATLEEERKKSEGTQDTHINWSVFLQGEEDFDEAFAIIRNHFENSKEKGGKFLLTFSIKEQ